MSRSSTTALAMMIRPTQGVIRNEGEDFMMLDRSVRRARETLYRQLGPTAARGWWPSHPAACLPLNRRVHLLVSSENRLASIPRASGPREQADQVAGSRPSIAAADRPGRSPATSPGYTCTRNQKPRVGV